MAVPVGSLALTFPQYYSERNDNLVLPNFYTVSDGSAVEGLGNSKILRPFRQIIVIESKMILKTVTIDSKTSEPYILCVFVKISRMGKNESDDNFAYDT